MPILSNLIVRIGASTDDFDKQVDRSLGKIKRFGADVSAAGQALAIGFSLPVIAAGGAALKAAADMETLNMGLKAVMRDSSATAREMEKLREVAKLPGLGLEEAVQGSIKLQILGNSADRSRKIMMEFGNALAIVGGGRDDFNEVIRQLGQMAAAGKVTADNLKPMTERIPQLAAIIKEKFGEEALGKPAETMKKLGLSSREFIDILVAELAKGERAGNTFKNSLENLTDSSKQMAAEFGKVLLPVAQRVLDEFLTPAIAKAKDLAIAFQTLSPATQNWAVGLTAAATAAPLVIVAFGTLIEKGAILFAALNKLAAPLKALAGAFSLVGTAAAAGGLAVGGLMKVLIDNRQSTVDTTAESIKQLNQKLGTGKIAFDQGRDAIMGYMKVMAPANVETKAAAAAQEEAAASTEKHTKAKLAAKLATTDLTLLHERMNSVLSEHRKQLGDAADILGRYNSVTIDGAIATARLADERFRLNRMLEDAPNLGTGLTLKDLPNAPSPNLPGPGGFEDFKKIGRNIHETGMMTKQQYDAMAQSASKSSRAQSAALKQVSTVITDLSRGITDVIFKGGKLGDMFASVAKQAAQSITRLLIEGALTKLSDKILSVGGIFGKVFGMGGGSGGGVPNVIAEGLGGSIGAGANIAGGASKSVSSATSGLMGTIGAIGAAVGAVSSIIGNVQMMGMNKSLDLIEKEVRYSQIHLGYILEKQNEYLPKLKDIWDSLIRMETRGMSLAGAGGVTINISGGNPQQTLDEITRLLKQYGVIPR